ncbi:hypothetical protein [Aureibacter tunicatorum]|uniref:Uncharacterized protein n=1 Tax=Aureibacter tunicatorum TaxID=866807 RepID=A0AAE3XMM9_9BACT|nr:hypothetical protein [Aureibacter tunicatorum]MDR6239257.1 hypothetical protein [Aureibacter tunicatorum]BDD04818.1 hypothetical protein AUTU_23010 [Aureibacter tunicatorum]
MKKIFLKVIAVFTVLFLSLVSMSFYFQNNMTSKYWSRYDEFRMQKGIYPLTESFDTTYTNWQSFVSSYYKHDLEWILSNGRVKSSSLFIYDTINSKPFHKSKEIVCCTCLFFWQNHYCRESDLFEKQISKDSVLRLTIEYHTGCKGSTDFFYRNIDTIDINPLNLVCGTFSLLDLDNNEIYTGNITKAKADEILRDWGLKMSKE